jgi:hypothetical protein
MRDVYLFYSACTDLSSRLRARRSRGSKGQALPRGKVTQPSLVPRGQWVGTTSRGPTGGRVPSWGNLITN